MNDPEVFSLGGSPPNFMGSVNGVPFYADPFCPRGIAYKTTASGAISMNPFDGGEFIREMIPSIGHVKGWK
jgi:hypothetical protein